MRYLYRSVLGGLLAGAALAAGASPSVTASPPADPVSATWQHHKLTFNYVGFTSLYTCDGLEDHVKQILLSLGARHDVKATATGCPGPLNAPSPTAWVAVDFYTIAPAVLGANPDAVRSDTVKAHWTPLELSPHRPSFMGDGDCELIQAMKDVITQNFALRDVDYRTSCFPHQLSPDGFAVTGQALRASTAPSSAP